MSYLDLNGLTYYNSKVMAYVNELKTSVTQLENDIYTMRLITGTASENYHLTGTGLCTFDSSSKMVKYSVIEGVLYKLNLSKDNAGVYQWQSAASVPASGTNQNVIGSPVTVAIDDIVEAPEGAKYLIVSQFKTNTTNKVYSVEINDIEFFDDENRLLSSAKRQAPAAVSNGWMLNTNGVSEQNENIRMLKYRVTAGTDIRVLAKKYESAVYQFQNDAVVPGPTESPTTRVGDTVTNATAEIITVPTGATYIIINDLLDGEDNGLYIFTPSDCNISNEINKVNLIAHRGGYQGHDGTFARLNYSYLHGYKILEMDVRFTSDNIPIIQHDPTIVVNGTTYTIANQTYADLVALDLGDGEHIITLDLAVLFCKKRGLCIEIDTTNENMNAAKANSIVEIVIERGMIGSTIFTAVPTTLTHIITNAKNTILSVSSLYDAITTETIDSIAEYKDFAQKVICSINHENVTEALVDYAHQKELLVKTWTHDTSSSVNADLAIGVDLAICDSGIYPDNLVITD